MSQSLNSEQKKAVKLIGSPLLIFAGAGSGKTRVLTEKIAHLIEDIGMPPEHILSVTFTNKATKEMQDRVLRFIDQKTTRDYRIIIQTKYRIIQFYIFCPKSIYIDEKSL